MTSVSHPLIADIAPSRSSTRPDAPAREPRREDEKFSIPEAPQDARERAEIPDAPVAPVLPVRPRVDHAQNTPDTIAPNHTGAATVVADAGTAPAEETGAATNLPSTPAAASPGLIAGIAGDISGNSQTGQTAAAAATQATGTQTAPATPPAGQTVTSGATPQSTDTQTAATVANTHQPSGVAVNAGQTPQPVVPTGPAVTATVPTGTQPPQAAQQVAATASTVRTGPGGTTSSGTTTADPTTPTGKNALLDQQSGSGEATGKDFKKPGTDFATSLNTAFGSADTTAAKPALTQASAQIMAQAMASAPAMAAATPEPTVPSLTAPAPVTGDALGVTQSFNAEMRAAIDAPTQAAAYTARGAVTAQPAAEQIAMQITRAADQNIDRMTVHLKPAELGKVTIDLEVGPDNRLLAVISAERSETLDLLQRDAKSLEKALNDAGVKTDSGSLEFNLKGEGGTAENGQDGDGKLHDGAVMLPGDIDAPDAANMPTNAPLILPEGRIDIQV